MIQIVLIYIPQIAILNTYFLTINLQIFELRVKLTHVFSIVPPWNINDSHMTRENNVY